MYRVEPGRDEYQIYLGGGYGLGGHFSHLPSPIAINFRARPVGTFETKIAPRGKRSMLTTLEKNSVNHYN